MFSLRSAAVIDGSEKRNGWLNFELQSPHVIETGCSNTSDQDYKNDFRLVAFVKGLDILKNMDDMCRDIALPYDSTWHSACTQ